MLTIVNQAGWAGALLAACVLLVGNVYFGRFEQETARWRRLLKFTIVIGGAFVFGGIAGLAWSLAWIALLAAVGLVAHFTWTRKHGIDPFTAEPYARYRQLRGWR